MCTDVSTLYQALDGDDIIYMCSIFHVEAHQWAA